jgi:hypothetical protein
MLGVGVRSRGQLPLITLCFVPVRTFARFSFVLGVALVGCRDGTPPVKEPPAPATVIEAPRGGSAEANRLGDSRWKDVGVYVDGKLVGFLGFGDLPIALAPVWKEEEVSVPIKPGQKDVPPRIVRQRHYRFTDYLAAVGVDLAGIKTMHVYGPRLTQTIVVDGDELRRRGSEFMFRFGGEVSGKPIPVVPSGFGNEKSPDKLTAVLVYRDKVAPTLRPNVGFFLDDKKVDDVPYYGEPARGGIRVYLDDRLVAFLKRRQLALAPGQSALSLFGTLNQLGVPTGSIVEGWTIFEDKRTARFAASELTAMTFASGEKSHGQITLGPAQIPANALAFHTRALDPEELPQPTVDER